MQAVWKGGIRQSKSAYADERHLKNDFHRSKSAYTAVWRVAITVQKYAINKYSTGS